MKCAACGAELAEGSMNCSACGRELGIGQKVGEESAHLAKETGVAAEKVGKGLWGGVKAVGHSAKKGLKDLEGKKDP